MTSERYQGPINRSNETRPITPGSALYHKKKGRKLGLWPLLCKQDVKKTKLRAPLNSGLREPSKMFLPHVQEIKIRLKLI